MVNTADVAEFAQGVLALGRPGLNLLGRKVGRGIRTDNVLNYPLSAPEQIVRRTQTHPAQKCIRRAQVVRVFQVMLNGIGQGVRALADKVGI